MESIVKDFFCEFVKYRLSKYSDYTKTQIGFISSIAFYFKEKLSEVLKESGLKLSKVMKSPLDGLVEYHCGE